MLLLLLARPGGRGGCQVPGPICPARWGLGLGNSGFRLSTEGCRDWVGSSGRTGSADRGSQACRAFLAGAGRAGVSGTILGLGRRSCCALNLPSSPLQLLSLCSWTHLFPPASLTWHRVGASPSSPCLINTHIASASPNFLICKMGTKATPASQLGKLLNPSRCASSRDHTHFYRERTPQSKACRLWHRTPRSSVYFCLHFPVGDAGTLTSKLGEPTGLSSLMAQPT